MTPVDSLDRIAAGPWLSLVARCVHIAEVRAAGALHDVAGRGSHVAELGRGTGEDRLREHRVSLADRGVPRELAVADIGADVHAPPVHVDRAERQPVDIDESLRSEHIDLHQIDQRRAARKKHGPRDAAYGAHRRGSGRFLNVSKRIHGVAPRVWVRWTCRIAARMLG